MSVTRRRFQVVPVLCLIAVLAGCAAAPAEWTAMPPAEARFNVLALLPGRPPIETQRAVSSNLRMQTERFRFADGIVLAGQTFPGSKLTPQGLEQYGGQDAVRSWALLTHARAGAVLSVEPVAHERLRGQGWLVTYSLRESQTRCTAGRSYLATEGRDDDQGLTYDTIVSAVFCHAGDAVPADVRALFRRLQPTEG